MNHAEKMGLQDEQWGSRKHRSSTDLGLDKQLLIEYLKLTGYPIGMVDLDAAACYDRIIRSVGIAALIKFGLPVDIARCLLARSITSNFLKLSTEEHHNHLTLR